MERDRVDGRRPGRRRWAVWVRDEITDACPALWWVRSRGGTYLGDVRKVTSMALSAVKMPRLQSGCNGGFLDVLPHLP